MRLCPRRTSSSSSSQRSPTRAGRQYDAPGIVVISLFLPLLTLKALNLPLDSLPLLDERVLQCAHVIDVLHQQGLGVVQLGSEVPERCSIGQADVGEVWWLSEMIALAIIIHDTTPITKVK